MMVAAQRMLIEQIKYTISITPAEAPNCTELLLEQVNVLNIAFINTVTECLNAEEEILEKSAAKKNEKVVEAKLFIDLTIATVLGTAEDEEDDCEIIVNASACSVLSNKKMKANLSGLTPISSNKKRKVHCPVRGRTMTSPIGGRLKDNISPLFCKDEDSE
jgi:hypothetical protein